VSRSVKPNNDLSTCPLSRASPTSSPQGGESRQNQGKMQPSFDSDVRRTAKHHPSQGLTRLLPAGRDRERHHHATLRVSRPKPISPRHTPAASRAAARSSDDCSPRGSPRHALPPDAKLRSSSLHPRQSESRARRWTRPFVRPASESTTCNSLQGVHACDADAKLTEDPVHPEPAAAGPAVHRSHRSEHRLSPPHVWSRRCSARSRGTHRRARPYADRQADCMSCRYFTSDCEELRRCSSASSQTRTRSL